MSEQTTPANAGEERLAATDEALSEANGGAADASQAEHSEETQSPDPSETNDLVAGPAQEAADEAALKVDEVVAEPASDSTSTDAYPPAPAEEAAMDDALAAESTESPEAASDEPGFDGGELVAGADALAPAEELATDEALAAESTESPEVASDEPGFEDGELVADANTLAPTEELATDEALAAESTESQEVASDEPSFDGGELVAEADAPAPAEVAATDDVLAAEAIDTSGAASDEPAFDGVELVAEAETPVPAEEAGQDDVLAAQSIKSPGVASDDVPVDGTGLVAESDSFVAPSEIESDGLSVARNDVLADESGEPAADALAATALDPGQDPDVEEQDKSASTPTDTPFEPVLAADAIAAHALASAPEAEQVSGEDTQAEPAEATPVVIDREITWGFIDTEGRIHQKTTEHFRGRSVGKVIGSGEAQIAEFESKFGPLAKEVELLEADVTSAKNKVSVMGRVRKMKSTAGRADALGDFDDLFLRLQTLEQTIQAEIDERRAGKEALIEQAEALKDSTEWKTTGEAYKNLFQEWKQIGATGREADDSLWARFIGARENFNTRRGEHFNQRQEQWEANRLLKQDVIVRAHELSISDQWRPTGDALRALFDEWKKIGSAGRQSDEELWQQFRGAQQHFYDRRNAAYDENRQRKDGLCQRAEDLSGSTDWNATVEEMKAMMADWKTVGTSGKRDVDDVLWNRFRGAQNAFFDKRYADASAREQEERSQSQRKDEVAAAIEALAYSTDAVAAGEQALELRAQFEALPSIRRDREEALQRRIRKAMGDIRVNAAAEGARRAVSWQGKLREALERSQDQIEGLQQTIANQEASLEEAKTSLAGANDEEKPELEKQIQELYEGVSYNQAEIERLKGSVSEIQDNVQV